MDKNIEDRFKVLEQTLNSDDFLKSRGLGNEVGYYIFDYNPRDELVVREYVRNLKKIRTLQKRMVIPYKYSTYMRL